MYQKMVTQEKGNVQFSARFPPRTSPVFLVQMALRLAQEEVAQLTETLRYDVPHLVTM